jgi:hypothetical protein
MSNMTANRIWVLGAADPEMTAIEALLRSLGERVEYATVYRDGASRRVRPAEAYAADCGIGDGIAGLSATAITVECRPAVLYGSDVAGIDWASSVDTIDHHNPGDPGYGRAPADFWTACSLGQVVTYLAGCGIHVEVTSEMRLTAAADHCCGAAYRGQCPGIDPDELMRWRCATRAAFQGIAESDLLARVEAATAALRAAKEICLESVSDMVHTEYHDWSSSVCDGCNRDPVYARDMRRDAPVPELPEAAMRLGMAYLSGPLIGTDGRHKYTVSGEPMHVRAFLDSFAEREGLIDTYGDPARGFAGGYAKAS